MSNDNRVPAGVPTGGEFAPSEHDENADLPDPGAERAARIESILTASDIEDRTRGLIEETGITFEPGGRTNVDMGDDLMMITWRSTFTNPHTGKTMTRDLVGMSRGATSDMDLDESMISITSEAWAVDQVDSSEEYARDSGFAHQTDEEKAEAKSHWDEAVARRDELRDFLGEDYDAFVHGRSVLA